MEATEVRHLNLLIEPASGKGQPHLVSEALDLWKLNQFIRMIQRAKQSLSLSMEAVRPRHPNKTERCGVSNVS